MIPLKDDLPTRRRPYVTWALLVLNVAIFLWAVRRADASWLVLGTGGQHVAIPGLEATLIQWGLVPCELAQRCHADILATQLTDGQSSFAARIAVPHEPLALTVLASMFLHGSWTHLGGNMLYLWIFGNNVEDALGRVRFVAFYLLGGLVAGLAQVLVDPGSDVPTIGASGAIAAVLGGYLMLFPRARVLCFMILVLRVPAVVPLVLWAVLQVRSGAASLGGPIHAGGVAYFAHIGGFAVGFLLVRALVRERRIWNGRTYVWPGAPADL